MFRKIDTQLLAWKNSPFRKPLILYGSRQVGKTHALKNFGKAEFGKTFYLNFEEKRDDLNRLFGGSLSSKEIVTRIELLFQDRIDIERDLLILDEIQQCPRALTSLKYFAETMSQLAVCCAGSHLGIALSDEAFPVGQVDMLHLFPMDFEEFLGEADPQLTQATFGSSDWAGIDEFLHARLWESLKIYYMTGGLPAAVASYLQRKESLVEAFGEVREVQRNLIAGYISDFSKHAGKENANHIHRVFENVPVQLSRQLDASTAKFTFKGVIPQKGKYEFLAGPINWLVKAGLVIKVPIVEMPSIPLKAFAKENVFKLYLFDVGILGAMLDLPLSALRDQDYGMYKGFFAENFVAQQFVASGARDLFAWTHRTSEVEFVRVLNGEVIPIEVKSGQRTRAKSLASYAERYSPSRMIHISGRPYHRGSLVTNYPLYLAGKIRDNDTAEPSVAAS
jgi:hypothetical protein